MASPASSSQGFSSGTLVQSLCSPTSMSLHDDKGASYGSASLKWPRLAALTCSILGVQMFWSVLMAHGTPYLQSLGFPPALTSLVWMAGPLGGVLIQPLVGIWSDGYVPQRGSIFEGQGRRKPFIVTGALGIIICLLGLANVREGCEFLALALGINGDEVEDAFRPHGRASSVVITLAIIWVYALNAAIQPLQVGVRAFVADCVPTHQQDEASAWISRWNTFGAVFTFWLGSVDLPTHLQFLGREQFQALAILEVLVIAVTIPISLAASEKMKEVPPIRTIQPISVLNIWARLWTAFKLMPQTTWNVLKIQFWAWLAWFPFLYYHTVYIGHLAYLQKEKALSTPEPTAASKTAGQPTSPQGMSATEAAQAGSFASFLFALASLVFTFLLPLATRYIAFVTLQRLWFVAHVVHATIMFLTFWVNSLAAGTALVACLGFSWALSQWAPFAIIASESSQAAASAREDDEIGWNDDGGVPGRQSPEAGAIFGLHNVAMASPQVIAAIQSAGMFKIFSVFHSDDEVGWVLRCAGLAALGAVWTSKKLID